MEKSKGIAILGSARTGGNTEIALRKLSPIPNYDIVDLNQLNIKHYQYDHAQLIDDDFLPVIERILLAQHLVFATPVYWYAMSGLMKVFFDRLTELLTTSKHLGKAMKGKKCYLIGCGTEAEFPIGFEIPFRLTCRYFEMDFVSSHYLQVAGGKHE